MKTHRNNWSVVDCKNLPKGHKLIVWPNGRAMVIQRVKEICYGISEENIHDAVYAYRVSRYSIRQHGIVSAMRWLFNRLSY